MKKLLVILIILFIPFNIKAQNKQIVTLNKCVDGDTAWVNLNDEVIKLRFLAINTPESTNKIEPYGKEASKFTCNLLKKASKIEIEYDNNSDKFDKYNRHLVWVFVDNKLLQDLIVKEGLAEVKYIYGDYKYLDKLENSLEDAKINHLNIWSDSSFSVDEIIRILVIIVILILLYIFNKKSRKKIKNYVKKNIKKIVK